MRRGESIVGRVVFLVRFFTLGPFDNWQTIAYKDGLRKRFGALWVRAVGRSSVPSGPCPVGGRLVRVGGVGGVRHLVVL